MASKQGYAADLKSYIDKRLKINLNGKRILQGRLRGYDPFMNLVLEDCVRIINNVDEKNNVIENKEEIGTVMIRGNSVILWECLDKIQGN